MVDIKVLICIILSAVIIFILACRSGIIRENKGFGGGRGGGRGGGGGGRGFGGRGFGGFGRGGGRGGFGGRGGHWGGRGGGWRGGYGGGWWGWPSWWYNPYYYYPDYVITSDDEGCNTACLNSYKAAIDAGVEKEKAVKILEECAKKC